MIALILGRMIIESLIGGRSAEADPVPQTSGTPEESPAAARPADHPVLALPEEIPA
jgi:hypothetical protein